MEKITKDLENWAIARDIMHHDNASKQFLKVMEEVGELAAAYSKHDGPKFYDSVGDTMVTVIILALQCGIDPDKALTDAYNVIADRKGKTINGVFVKDEDLNDDTSM